MNLETAWPDLRAMAATGKQADQVTAMQMLVMGAFAGKYRYGGLTPMWVHSTRVGLQLERHGLDAATILAGFGHNLLEDTQVTAGEIETLFGDEVLRLIRACTLNSQLYEKNHTEGNDDLFVRVEAAGSEAIFIKVVDIDDNLATYHQVPRMWQDEMLYCAVAWHDLGASYLGQTHPAVLSLSERLCAVSAGGGL